MEAPLIGDRLHYIVMKLLIQKLMLAVSSCMCHIVAGALD